MSQLPRLTGALLALGRGIAACTPAGSARLAQSSLPRDVHPSLPADAIAQPTASNSIFATELYQRLVPHAGNLVFSPFSISIALAMPYAGARGETELQMARVLHFALPQADLQRAFDQLDLTLTQEGQASADGGQPMQLDIACGAWAEQTIAILPQYLDTLSSYYGAGLHLADFVNQPDAARRQINSWVGQQTKDKIKNMIPDGALGFDARLVLVNAIYFKADWQAQFDPRDTKPGDFTRLDGSQVQVQMMSKSTTTVPYVAGSVYQAVELPYQGGGAAMDVIVPDQGAFQSFEAGLDAQALNQILGSMQRKSLALTLPKFRFDGDFDLANQLSDMGMPDAFDPSRADFSAITGDRDLFIARILHEAQVAVDEKGTEAAAATSVIMAPTLSLEVGMMLRVDRPFIFIIRDLGTGQILFLGRVLDPTQP